VVLLLPAAGLSGTRLPAPPRRCRCTDVAGACAFDTAAPGCMVNRPQCHQLCGTTTLHHPTTAPVERAVTLRLSPLTRRGGRGQLGKAMAATRFLTAPHSIHPTTTPPPLSSAPQAPDHTHTAAHAPGAVDAWRDPVVCCAVVIRCDESLVQCHSVRMAAASIWRARASPLVCAAPPPATEPHPACRCCIGCSCCTAQALGWSWASTRSGRPPANCIQAPPSRGGGSNSGQACRSGRPYQVRVSWRVCAVLQGL
jgi:hypothetical protein